MIVNNIICNICHTTMLQDRDNLQLQQGVAIHLPNGHLFHDDFEIRQDTEGSFAHLCQRCFVRLKKAIEQPAVAPTASPKRD